jgi:hypothetical protein
LLPFMEQSAIHAEISAACAHAASMTQANYNQNRIPRADITSTDAAPSAANAFLYVDASGEERRNPFTFSIDAFLCPSDSVVRRGGTPAASGRNSYRLNHGDIPFDADWPGRGVGNNFHAFWSWNLGSGDRVRMTINSISDGTSNTIYASERAVTQGSGDGSLISGVAEHDTGQGQLHNRPPRACLDMREGNEISSTVLPPLSRSDSGYRWGDARTRYTLFFTILPPNSIACLGSGAQAGGYYGASSHHPGGVNVVMADASGRFISNSISSGNPNDRPGEINGVRQPGFRGDGSNPDHFRDWAGPSSYGVWGALGSRAGGESVSL